MLVDQTLSAICSENIIEGETFGLLFIILSQEIDLLVDGIDFNNTNATYIGVVLPLSNSLWFMGLQRTMTLTAYDIIEIKFNNRLLSLFRLKE